MARRRKSRRTRRSRKASKSRPMASRSNIKKALVLAGIGFGLYMVMNGKLAPKAAPMVATVDGQPAPLSIVTSDDLQRMMNA